MTLKFMHAYFAFEINLEAFYFPSFGVIYLDVSFIFVRTILIMYHKKNVKICDNDDEKLSAINLLYNLRKFHFHYICAISFLSRGVRASPERMNEWKNETFGKVNSLEWKTIICHLRVARTKFIRTINA